MVVTQGCSCTSDGAGFGSRVGFMDDPIQEIFQLTHSILEQTPMLFVTVKEGISEILDERLALFVLRWWQ